MRLKIIISCTPHPHLPVHDRNQVVIVGPKYSWAECFLLSTFYYTLSQLSPFFLSTISFSQNLLCFSSDLTFILISRLFIVSWYRICCSDVYWFWAECCWFENGEGLIRGKRKMPGRDELSVAKDGPTDIEDYLKQHRFWLLQTDITGQSANCPWKSARCFCFLVSWKVDPMHLSQLRKYCDLRTETRQSM